MRNTSVGGPELTQGRNVFFWLLLLAVKETIICIIYSKLKDKYLFVNNVYNYSSEWSRRLFSIHSIKIKLLYKHYRGKNWFFFQQILDSAVVMRISVLIFLFLCWSGNGKFSLHAARNPVMSRFTQYQLSTHLGPTSKITILYLFLYLANCFW